MTVAQPLYLSEGYYNYELSQHAFKMYKRNTGLGPGRWVLAFVLLNFCSLGICWKIVCKQINLDRMTCFS